jgi:hypothetical protein
MNFKFSGVLRGYPPLEGVVRSLSLTTEFPSETRAAGGDFPLILFLLLNIQHNNRRKNKDNSQRRKYG